MNKFLLLILLAVPVLQDIHSQSNELIPIASTNADGKPKDWENQKVISSNKEYYHVNVVPYSTFDRSLQMDYTRSAF